MVWPTLGSRMAEEQNRTAIGLGKSIRHYLTLVFINLYSFSIGRDAVYWKEI